MTAREKFTRALREGRILRNAKGHIVIPKVVKPGVVLTRPRSKGITRLKGKESS